VGGTAQAAAAVEVERVRETARAEDAPSVLEARGVGRAGAVAPFDLVIRRGEVVGLAGLLGSGRTETARLLFGADRRDTGEISVGGRRARMRSPRDAIGLGMGLCPE